MALHTANWEVTCHALAEQGHIIHAMYMPPRNPLRHALTRWSRKRGNLVDVLAPGPHTLRRAAKVLRDGQNLTIYVDEYLRGNVISPSLGRPRATRSNLAYAVRLGLRTDARLFFCWAEREETCRFTVHVKPFPSDPHGKSADFDALLRQADLQLGHIILDNLDQWFNLHALILPSQPRGEHGS
jgi:lauroyl/myristoyl acyltransferase